MHQKQNHRQSERQLPGSQPLNRSWASRIPPTPHYKCNHLKQKHSLENFYNCGSCLLWICALQYSDSQVILPLILPLSPSFVPRRKLSAYLLCTIFSLAHFHRSIDLPLKLSGRQPGPITARPPRACCKMNASIFVGNVVWTSPTSASKPNSLQTLWQMCTFALDARL